VKGIVSFYLQLARGKLFLFSQCCAKQGSDTERKDDRTRKSILTDNKEREKEELLSRLALDMRKRRAFSAKTLKKMIDHLRKKGEKC